MSRAIFGCFGLRENSFGIPADPRHVFVQARGEAARS
jgi:hypothetical protein